MKEIFGAEDLCVKVYNPTKQELIATYKNYKDAASKLGLTHKVITTACRDKKRRFCTKLNIEISLRLSSIK